MTGIADIGDARFSVAVEPEGDRVRVAVAGELDLASAPELEAALAAAMEAGEHAHVVVDLRALRFVDSSGLHVLVTAKARAEARGLRFSLIAGSEAVQRPFVVAGLATRFDYVE